jgi:uncharacterized damage-inducible protein DinB
MECLEYFRLQARDNRLANERLYAACSTMGDAEYRHQRRGSFGSIHGLLNHIMVGDRLWMARFEGGGRETPVLATILFDDFPALRAARSAEDARIERFFQLIDPPFLARSFAYTSRFRPVGVNT